MENAVKIKTMSEIDKYLKDLPEKTQEEKRWKTLSDKADGHYFISSWEKGDDYSESVFLVSDLQDAVKTVEKNDCDWIECIYNYAIVWKIRSSSYLITDTTEIVGVYRVEDSDNLEEEQGWIDFEVKETEKGNFKLVFDGFELEINKKTGPNLTSKYKKNRILSGYYLY